MEKTVNIVNLTPHEVTIVNESLKQNLSIAPSGKVARVQAKTERTGVIFNGMIPVSHTVYSEVEELPDETPGTIYIVSSIVASRVPNRKDVYIPNESVRDEKGRIIGCRSLGHI